MSRIHHMKIVSLLRTLILKLFGILRDKLFVLMLLLEIKMHLMMLHLKCFIHKCHVGKKDNLLFLINGTFNAIKESCMVNFPLSLSFFCYIFSGNEIKQYPKFSLFEDILVRVNLTRTDICPNIIGPANHLQIFISNRSPK